MSVRWRGISVALVLVGVVSQAAAGILQITDLPVNRFVGVPSINGDGRYVALNSSGNLGGLDPTGFGNVFVYDMNTHLFSLVTTEGAGDPTISADGRWLSFTSSADYAHRNIDGSDEIFRYDRQRRRFLQLTRDVNGDGSSENPVISGNGKRVAFETNSNLRRRNPDFSDEVFFFNRAGNVALSADPNGDGSSFGPVISADGSAVVFRSSSDLTGHNPNFGQELMIYDVQQRDLSQATFDPDGFGDAGSPAISGDSRFIAFTSSLNLGGLNPDGDFVLYLMNRLRRSFSIITSAPDGFFDGDLPTLNNDGRWVAFVSGSNVTQGNSDFNGEILLFDRVRKTFSQVTDSSGCFNSNPKISGDGSRIAVLSNCDYTGGNADRGFEVFVADNPALNLVVHSSGPVSLQVTDPNGLVITPTSNAIAGASYAEGDFDGDMVPEDRVTISRAVEGVYHIAVVGDAGAAPTDPVVIDATLNALTVPLITGTVASLSATPLSFSNQGFTRRVARITSLGGLGSVVSLNARLAHAPAAAGPVRIRFSDGTNEAAFDFGPIESFGQYSTGRIFKGGVSGFLASMRVTKRPGGTTSIAFSAKDGDLSMFDGTGDLSMTMVVQIGPDTDMYQWRFRRLLSGKLILK